MTNPVGSTTADEDLPSEGPISIELNLDLVLSRRETKPLKGSVEVVNSTDVRSIYKNLGGIAELLRL